MFAVHREQHVPRAEGVTHGSRAKDWYLRVDSEPGGRAIVEVRHIRRLLWAHEDI